MKSKKSIRYWLFVACLLLIFSSCKNIQPLAMQGVAGFKVKEMTLSGVVVEVGLKIKNPNPFGINIYPSSVDFKVNNIEMQGGKILKKVKIKGNSEEVQVFTIKADLSKTSGLMNNIMEIMKSKSVVVEVSGNVKAGKFLIKKKFPIKVRERVNLGR